MVTHLREVHLDHVFARPTVSQIILIDASPTLCPPCVRLRQPSESRQGTHRKVCSHSVRQRGLARADNASQNEEKLRFAKRSRRREGSRGGRDFQHVSWRAYGEHLECTKW